MRKTLRTVPSAGDVTSLPAYLNILPSNYLSNLVTLQLSDPLLRNSLRVLSPTLESVVRFNFEVISHLTKDEYVYQICVHA